MSFNIAFVLYPGFEELDLAGPYEVYGAARKIAAPEWRVFTVAREETVRGANGLSVNAEYGLGETPPPNMLVVPGGEATGATVDEGLIDYVRSAGNSAEVVTSVCTGAFILHRAGLLAGKRATTYWAARDLLNAMGAVTVVADRWVDDGNLITAAGVSAGIDMALYVVGQLLSPNAALDVQHYIEYHPAPPYADISTA